MPAPFAACRYAGQVGNLRRIANPPAFCGSQSWLPILAAASFSHPRFVSFFRKGRSRQNRLSLM
jgi:hypothetical protein